MENSKKEETSELHKIDNFMLQLIKKIYDIGGFTLLLSLIIVFIIIFIWLISDNYFRILNLNDKNEIGDALGGLTAPFIGITGVVLTFLAFYVQYVFNKNQSKIVEEQHLIAIKQSYDPHFLMLIQNKHNFLNDQRNTDIVNELIDNKNEEDRKNNNLEMTTSTAMDIENIDGWRKGQLTIIIGIQKIKFTEEIFKRHLDSYLGELQGLVVKKLISEGNEHNHFRIKFNTIKIKERDIYILRSFLNSDFRNPLYTEFLRKYRNHLNKIFSSIDNQKFHSNDKINIELKMYYTYQFFSTLSIHECIYSILILTFEKPKLMKQYFYADKSRNLNLQTENRSLNNLIEKIFDLYS